MTQVPGGNPAEVADGDAARAAVDRLGVALSAHLAAVENRSGEHDPAVQGAYLELRAAAAAYDDLLYNAHGEVTPFDLPDLPDDDAEQDADEEGGEVVADSGGGPPRLALLARWDFTVADADLLRATAAAAVGEEVASPGVALAALSAAQGHSRIADVQAAAAAGLRWHGATTWVVEATDAEPGADGEEWMDDAFIDAEPGSVLCRVDVPVVWTK